MDVIYQKIWADLWGNKARTFQVSLIVALGAFGIGLVIGGRALIVRAAAKDWQTADPPAIKLDVSPFMSDEQLGSLKSIDNIVEVEGLLSTNIEWRRSPDEEWQSATLNARSDYLNQKMSKEYLVSGDWPARNLFAIGQGSDTFFRVNEGETIWTRINGRERQIELGGTINRIGSSPIFGGKLMLFTTRARFAAFLNRADYNTIQINIGEFDQATAEAVDQEIKVRLKKLGIDSKGATEPLKNRVVPPDINPAVNILNTVFAIMGIVGSVIVLLGIFLVFNSVTAIITQQIGQIGVMKAIGASTSQIFKGYLLLVFAYGLLASLMAVPLGSLAAYGIKLFFANLLNFSDKSFQIDPTALFVQVTISLVAPLAASLIPITAGVRITVHEAISTYGLSSSVSYLDKWMARLRGIPYSVLLTIGNTFRNGQRVILIQIVLVGSGLIFMAVVGAYDSTQYTFRDELQSIHRYQVAFSLQRSERIGRIEQLLLNEPDVIQAEVWTTALATGHPATQRKSSVDDQWVRLIGQPVDTALYLPKIEKGRWLQPGDSNVVVLNKIMAQKIGVDIGEQIIFTRNDGKESAWWVVGIVFDPMIDENVHMPQEALTRFVGELNKANSVWIQTAERDPQQVKEFALRLEATFEERNIPIKTDTIFRENTIHEISDRKLTPYDLIVWLLAIMATVIAVVGGIGLSGVLTLSVLDRTREIGVMRAIGASSGRISRLFIGEGLILGILSWLIALPLSIPVAYLLSTQVISMALDDEIVYHFTFLGPIMWLVIICLLAIVASWIPARNAARLSVRESLAYQ